MKAIYFSFFKKCPVIFFIIILWGIYKPGKNIYSIYIGNYFVLFRNLHSFDGLLKKKRISMLYSSSKRRLWNICICISFKNKLQGFERIILISHLVYTLDHKLLVIICSDPWLKSWKIASDATTRWPLLWIFNFFFNLTNKLNNFWKYWKKIHPPNHLQRFFLVRIPFNSSNYFLELRHTPGVWFNIIRSGLYSQVQILDVFEFDIDFIVLTIIWNYLL